MTSVSSFSRPRSMESFRHGTPMLVDVSSPTPRPEKSGAQVMDYVSYRPAYDYNSRAPSILDGHGISRPASVYSPSASFEDLSASFEDAPLYANKRKSRPPIWIRAKNAFLRHFDIVGFLRLFDFRPWFYPFTWRKYFVLLILACIIAGIVLSDHYTGWVARSLEITRSYMLPVLIISVCAEPLIIMIALPVAKMPDISAEEVHANLDVESSAAVRQRSAPFETAMVFPCHDTDFRVMKTTIDSCLPHFRPQDIFVVDNGKSKYPTHPEGNFREYIRSLHPDINYMWSPIGSKNAAQFVGALAAREKGYKYIMTADDDVCMPKNWTPGSDLLDDKFVAVAYPIKAMDDKCMSSLWVVAWQDVEYRLSGLAKLAESRLSGVLCPHGAGWFVEINAFIKLMEFYHPMDFISEDSFAGLGISKMGKGIKLDARCYLATEVPATFFGPGLNWWKQRQKSWEMGRHGLIFAYARQLLFALPPKKTIQGILWYKLSYLYVICGCLIDWLRIPTIIALGRTATWWRNAILLMLFSTIPPMLYNYWKCRWRKDMRAPFWASLTFPLYKQIYTVVSILGAIRWAGYYLGGHVRSKPIQQMLKEGDWRCFWLDPRFKTNPAYLADEAEAAEREKAPPAYVMEPVINPFSDETAITRMPPQAPDRVYMSSPLARSSSSVHDEKQEWI